MNCPTKLTHKSFAIGHIFIHLYIPSNVCINWNHQCILFNRIIHKGLKKSESRVIVNQIFIYFLRTGLNTLFDWQHRRIVIQCFCGINMNLDIVVHCWLFTNLYQEIQLITHLCYCAERIYRDNSYRTFFTYCLEEYYTWKTPFAVLIRKYLSK